MNTNQVLTTCTGNINKYGICEKCYQPAYTSGGQCGRLVPIEDLPKPADQSREEYFADLEEAFECYVQSEHEGAEEFYKKRILELSFDKIRELEARNFDTKAAMDLLTDYQRLEIMSNYCRGCGSTDPRCQCWNDD